MTWVFTHSTAAGADRLLLLAIADHAGDDGRNAWPAVPTLARKTGVSERTVQRGIARLESAGLLLVERGKGAGGTNRYQVLMPVAGDSVTPPDEETKPAPNPRQSVTGDNSAPVTQLRHPGGDTQASPERPERPSSPQPPDAVGGRTPRRKNGKPTRPSRADGTNPRAVRAAAVQAAAERSRAAAADERRARQQAIAACGQCSKAGYLSNGKVCDHDPDAPQRAARGLALVRDQLANRGDR